MTTAPRGFEGEGFPVRRAFAGVDLSLLDPFVHMDQMGEVEYAPGEPKGTPWHPHRGFETVTYMIDGVMDHQDSQGGGGSITNGDTQWMTAGSGMLHIETPPEWLVASGGLFHGIQLWVNLPRDQKWADAALPGPALQPARPGDHGRRRRAGAGHRRRRRRARRARARPTRRWRWCTGPWRPGARLDLPWQADFNALVYVLAGRRHGRRRARPSRQDSSRCSAAGDFVTLAADERQDEPARRASRCWCSAAVRSASRSPGAGPFVMNTKAEVLQAFEDFQKGRMGQVPAVHGLSNDVVEG